MQPRLVIVVDDLHIGGVWLRVCGMVACQAQLRREQLRTGRHLIVVIVFVAVFHHVLFYSVIIIIIIIIVSSNSKNISDSANFKQK